MSVPPRTLLAVLLLPSVAISEELSFEKHIRPIFRAHCYDCHGATEKVEGQLDLRLVRLLKQGGESGPAIVPGNPDDSYLIQRVRSGEMPPGEHRVPDDQVEQLIRWIALGAKTSRPEPESIGSGLGISEEERAYWFFQPIRRTDPPAVTATGRVRTPVDAFLLAQMQPQQLTFAPDADRHALIRRAYLDLLGLPPTPQQVQAFINDSDPAAWPDLIDQLLDSPHYGERWGRHWLDVAGYADSEGNGERDDVRPWAWKYRDWVIQAFNRDMPFDQFITWQLAGDELVTPPHKNMSPDHIDRLTATGFLRMASDSTQHANNEENRNRVVTDTIKIISSSLLGMSVGCAQCHDHRYDPVSQEDYYRLRAIFEPALNWRKWKPPSGRQVSLYTDKDIAKAAAVEQEASVKAKHREAKQKEYLDEALQKELSRHDETLRKPLEEAYRTAADKRTPEQKSLLAKFPSVASFSPGVLYQYNQKHADELKKLDQEIAAVRAKKPPHEYLRVLAEPNPDVIGAQFFYRGDYRQPQHDVWPGGLSIASAEPYDIPQNDETRTTTGRRLAWAQWLTGGQHPMTARVLVNRFWRHHFGQTFVSTPDEFGKLGTLPTHPELLDWLAGEFMANGWSLKQLHRLIMTSTVYMQQSSRHEAGNSVDGSNSLYWHFPVHRLDAEVLRDSVLSLSGRLDNKQFGPAAGISADDSGQIVVNGDKQQRSIYLQVRRTQPVAMLSSFDAPVMTTNCAKRSSSTVATQSLMLMNSDFILKSSRSFAERLNREAAGKLPENLTNGRFIKAPVSEPAKQQRWQYGYGYVDEEGIAGESVSQVHFTPYPHFSSNTWKGGEKVPDENLGYSFLNASGGHPEGKTTRPIRRWRAPRSGTIRIHGAVSRPSKNGDGVRLIVHSSRLGVQAECVVPTGEKKYSAEFWVERADLIDTLVDERENKTSDSFGNGFTIEMLDSDGLVAHTWKSEQEFGGPVSETKPYELKSPLVDQIAWGWLMTTSRFPTPNELDAGIEFVEVQLGLLDAGGNQVTVLQAMTNYCQALISSNQFLYVE